MKHRVVSSRSCSRNDVLFLPQTTTNVGRTTTTTSTTNILPGVLQDLCVVNTATSTDRRGLHRLRNVIAAVARQWRSDTSRPTSPPCPIRRDTVAALKRSHFHASRTSPSDSISPRRHSQSQSYHSRGHPAVSTTSGGVIHAPVTRAKERPRRTRRRRT